MLRPPRPPSSSESTTANGLVSPPTAAHNWPPTAPAPSTFSPAPSSPTSPYPPSQNLPRTVRGSCGRISSTLPQMPSPSTRTAASMSYPYASSPKLPPTSQSSAPPEPVSRGRHPSDSFRSPHPLSPPTPRAAFTSPLNM